MGMLTFTLAYAVICAVLTLAFVPGAIRTRLKTRGLALALLGEALLTLGFKPGQYGGSCAIVLTAGTIVVLAPRFASKLVPYGLFALGIYGLLIERAPSPQATAFYGAVPAPYRMFWEYFENGSSQGWVIRTGTAGFVLPQALVFFLAGLFLLLRQGGPVADRLRAWCAELRESGPVPGWLLLPVYGLWVGLFNPWMYLENTGRQLAILFLLSMTLVTVLLSRRIAAITAVFGLTVYAIYNVLVPFFWPALPAAVFGFLDVTDMPRALGAAALGAVLLGIVCVMRLWPRVITDSPERVLAERANWLSQRVQRLTQTRTDANDTAVAELRRIERDLHDGAQARLVALGMSLRAAEKLMGTDPAAALALIAGARETSSRALNDLRDLVRGIYPPVLADRGLGDALWSLALDAPLPVTVTGSIADGIPMPLGAAVYFAAAEALANAVRHANANRVQIHAENAGGMLRVEVTDDGDGGADAARGTGLAGVERRLATFDGILAMSSPVGGPTIVIIEVPCALSSAKISIS